MCGHRAQTWKFARSQVSAALSGLCPDRDVRAGMDLYRRCAGFSEKPASNGSAMLSQSNIGPAVAGSAEPACSAPRSRWEQCVNIYLVCHASPADV